MANNQPTQLTIPVDVQNPMLVQFANVVYVSFSKNFFTFRLSNTQEFICNRSSSPLYEQSRKLLRDYATKTGVFAPS
jgi:hypothetical protein